jgi:type IV pilus assembly protein PilC
MKFKYQARTKEGLIQVGIVDAPSRRRAVALLQEQGLYVTFLEAEERKPFYIREIKLFGGVKKKDVLSFSRQLSLMLKSGVSLVEALRAIALQSEKANFREMILKIADDVEGGTYFSDALSKFPKVFSSFFINMIKSGEASGKLADSLVYLADNLEREYTLFMKIRSGMTYPAFILLSFVGVGALMLFFVLPSFTETIKAIGLELPPITMAVISTGEFLRHWWWLVLLFLLLLGVLFWRYAKTKEGKIFLDRVFLKIPVIGNLFRKIYIVRFVENLSTLIFAGLPITQALEVVSGIIANKTYRDIIIEARDGVRRGEPMSAVLEKYPKSIPSMVVQMIKVGEKTGRLDESLLKIAEFYRTEINSTIEGLISIIEPVMIAILGALVAGLMLSIFLPVYRNIGAFSF